MAVNEHLPHGKGLCHSHQGIIYGLVAMGMVFSKHIANNSSTFPEWFVMGES